MTHRKLHFYLLVGGVLTLFSILLMNNVVLAQEEPASVSYSAQPAVNPQPWQACTPRGRARSIENDSRDGQRIADEHGNWHCTNGPTQNEPGRAFIAFHRQFILDYDIWRLDNGFSRVEYWDPFQNVFQNAKIPGNDETTNTGFTFCSDNTSVRPVGAFCRECTNIPNDYIGENLDNIDNLDQLGTRLNVGPKPWHGQFHIGTQRAVNANGIIEACPDIGSFLGAPRDPVFWMAHKKLDEITREWQSRQATDVVIVIDRSGSMDDNCPGGNADPGESPCAMNDAREAARTFANLIVDQRLSDGTPAAEQHRLGLVSFSNDATTHLGLTSVQGLVTDNDIDETAFEVALAGITPDSSTSIAAGIRQAIALLESVPSPNKHQAILVLTDGKENLAPCLGGNSPSECSGDALSIPEVGDIQIVAIGFGEGAEEANLRDVAERHGGIFIAQPNIEPLAMDSINLQKFFVTAFGRIYDEGISLDPRDSFNALQTTSDFFEIDIVDEERLTSVVGWEKANYMITFDEYASGTTDFDYSNSHGVIIEQGFFELAKHVINIPQSSTSSGTQALIGGFNGIANCEINPDPFCGDPYMRISFASGQSLVRLNAGLNFTTTDPVEALLIGFDVDGKQVAQDRRQLGLGPTSINTPLQITSTEQNIASLLIEFITGPSTAVRVTIDDLEFDNPEHYPSGPEAQQSPSIPDTHFSDCPLTLELYTPSGQLVDRNDTSVESNSGARHDFIRVTLPYQGESAGTWKGRFIRTDEGDRYLCGSQEYAYSVLVKGYGEIDPFISRSNTIVGQPLLAAFRINETNRPIGGFESVEAEVTLTRPNGATETHTLYDDGTNGDKITGNHLWSVQIPEAPQMTGTYHFLGRFYLKEGNSTRIRESEYAVVVLPEPDQCIKAYTTGPIDVNLWHRPQSGQNVQLHNFACVVNQCGNSDTYSVQINDNRGWLRVGNATTGELSPLPNSFTTGEIAPFSTHCFGFEPEKENPIGGIAIAGVIPDTAAVGDTSTISITVRSSAHSEEAVEVTTSLQVYPELDCNGNQIPDRTEIDGTSTVDQNGNAVLDMCERGAHHSLHEADLSVIVSVDKKEANNRDKLQYTIAITNVGPYTATDIVLNDVLPPELSLVSVKPNIGSCGEAENIVTCSIDGLSSGSTVTTSLVVQIDTTSPVTVTNKVFISSSLPDPDSQNNRAEVMTSVAPTVIRLGYLRVISKDDHPLVRWATSFEAGTRGFLIYRSINNSFEDAEVLTHSPIPSRGMSAEYEYTDKEAMPGMNYRYWLEERMTDGSKHLYGPVVISSEESQHQNFLPFISR